MTVNDRKVLNILSLRLTGSELDVHAVSQAILDNGGIDSTGLTIQGLSSAFQDRNDCCWNDIGFALSFTLIVDGTTSTLSVKDTKDGWKCLVYASSLLLLAQAIENGACDITDLAKHVVNGVALRQDAFDSEEVAYLMSRVFEGRVVREH
jgi:hypothetical protein